MDKVISLETPIQYLKQNLNKNSFFIKRDDMIPFCFGGNKVRKAQLFFEDLEEKKCDCVITYGSSSSNHCRIIANLAAIKNIPCYIISPNEVNNKTNNSTMMILFGAKVIVCPINKVQNTITTKLDYLKSNGLKPYFIPGGGHGNIGTQAYVEAYKEILDFEKKNEISFDYIFHTSGTGTTQAGLICGHVINNDSKKIIGISNARKKEYGEQIILQSVNDYLSDNDKGKVSMDEVNFVDDYIIEGYGSYNEEIKETIKKVMITEGIPLDTTYTGKAFWGMEEYIKKKNITGKNILFVHTGGTPLYFDNLEEILNE